MTNCKDKCWCRNFPIKSANHDLPSNMYDLSSIEHKIEHLYDGVEKCFERIESIEAEPKVKLSYHDSVFERIKKLEEMQKNMLTCPNIIWAKYNKTPHCCPVCDGKGQWFEEPSNEYHCNSCDGKGIVWG